VRRRSRSRQACHSIGSRSCCRTRARPPRSPTRSLAPRSPATWMTGPPLAMTPAARFLRHAIEMALAESGAGNTVLRWYDLLRQNELRLRAVLGEAGSRGRGRWRHLLHASGAIQGTSRIVREVERLRDEVREDESGDAKEARLASIDALSLAIRTLVSELQTLTVTQSVGAHARALRLFLRRWWSPSPRPADALEPPRGVGSLAARSGTLTLAEMLTTLEETLESTEALSGSLKDSSVRVLSPMQLLGAELDVVLVTGMNEGRFPARPREDPLLSDAILDALDRVTPCWSLPLGRSRAPREAPSCSHPQRCDGHPVAEHTRGGDARGSPAPSGLVAPCDRVGTHGPTCWAVGARLALEAGRPSQSKLARRSEHGAGCARALARASASRRGLADELACGSAGGADRSRALAQTARGGLGVRAADARRARRDPPRARRLRGSERPRL
jgi:hypothetical protein